MHKDTTHICLTKQKSRVKEHNTFVQIPNVKCKLKSVKTIKKNQLNYLYILSKT